MIFAKNDSELELKELPKWKKIAESGVSISLKRFIDGREVVSRQELESVFNKGQKTIQRYIKDGMPIHPASSRSLQIFDLEECISWRDKSVDKTQSIKTERLTGEPDASFDDDSDEERPKADMERKLKADADKAEEDAIIARLKREKEEGSLISSQDLDISQAELATVYQTTYVNDKKLLPLQLFGKSKDEMRTYLDSHYSKRMEDLDMLIHKEFPDCDESVYEVMSAVLDGMQNGISPSDIVKKIGKVENVSTT